jgi:hypothetical protein
MWLDWLSNRVALWGATAIADPPPPPRSRYAQAVLAVAITQIGRGEHGANNTGPDLDRYRNGGPGGAWCAAFVSWCLEQAVRSAGAVMSPVKRSHGAKRLFANVVVAGARVEEPAPGDIVCWHRGAKNAATGHVGIVSRVEGNAFYSIEGNRGGYPSRVREYGHEVGEALLLGFARLP